MRKYKKMSKLVNNTGYTPGTPSESNPINYIPSEDITMRNTPYPLYGQPLDHNGMAMDEPTYMEPGQDYKFGGASYVAETKAYKDGGMKQDWISEKIGILIKEGRPQKQAIAIAYSMWNQKHEMGGTQLPKYQFAGTAELDQYGQPLPNALSTPDPNYYQNNPAGMQTNFGGATSQTPQFNFKANPGIPQTLDLKLNGTEPWKNGLGANPNATNALGTVPTDYSSKFPLPAGMKPAMPKDIGYTPPTASEMAKGVQEATPNDGGSATRKKVETSGTGITQFINPYGDVGMDDALGFSGQQFAKGNTGAGIAGAGLALLKGTKTFLGAMGSQKRTNQIMKTYAEDQRRNMTGEDRPVEMVGRYGGYYQEGGEEDMGYESDMIDKYPNSARIESEIASRNPVFGPQEMPKDYVYPKTTVGESAIDESPLEETSNFDPNSARDTWVQKTGMPWSKAKELGYTSGTAKDNIKLLSELNDPRFKAENLRTEAPKRKTANRKAIDLNPKRLPVNINAYGIDTNAPEVIAYRDAIDKKSAEEEAKKPFGYGKPAYVNKNNAMLSGARPAVQTQSRSVMFPNYAPEVQQNPFAFYQEGGQQSLQEEGQEGMYSNPQEEQGEIPQQGGGDQMQAIAQEVAQMLQQGADPQEILQQLVQAGLPEEQAMQVIQMVMEQMQGGQPQATPQLGRGGQMIKRADGSYSERGMWDNIRDNKGSGKAPTKQMLEQERKIKANAKEMGGFMYADGGINNPGFKSLPKYVQDKIMSSMYQEGGEMMDEQREGENEGTEGETPSMEQIESQVEQALKQGADPQQILEQLVQMGIPEQQAVQMIQEIIQEMQGGETGMEAPEQGQPMMKSGGEYLSALKGKTIKNYTYNKNTGNYEVEFE